MCPETLASIHTHVSRVPLSESIVLDRRHAQQMTMKTVPSADHRRTIFSSVFPTSSLKAARPPKQSLTTRESNNIDSVAAILHDDSKAALGIGREDPSLVVPTASHASFHCFFPHCAPFDNDRPSAGEPQGRPLTTWIRLTSWRQASQVVERFGVSKIEKTFAAIVDKLITDFINWSYARTFKSSALPHLRFWVDNVLIPYVGGYLNLVKGRNPRAPLFDTGQVQKWHDLVLTRLATLRTSELFDIVVDWDSTTAAVDDLKQFATSPATRGYVTTDFAEALTTRMLHPGASTIEILTVYVSIIRAFRRLDARGVLLERVARKTRRYLRDREDTIKVVVAGLLADPAATESKYDPDTLHELARELYQHSSPGNKVQDTDLDFNNMEWQPDPIDAAPDYLKSKSTDVLTSLMTLFDSKDTFIRELQVTLSDRLLQNKPDFEQEISVIEHLKIRFGDSTLQACEVMLRDVLDSRKVDQVIRQDQAMDQMDEFAALSDVQLHTKILSRLFWPPLQEQEFRIPLPVRHQQSLYEKGFEGLKQNRKLTWLNAIGQVEVELELEDRVFRDEVLPWQASVIYAFQDGETTPGKRSVGDLAAELELSPALVRSACMFWSFKQVLTESPRDVFTVLETLPSGSDQDPTAAAGAQDVDAVAAEIAAAEAAREAEEAERKQKMGLYHQFIISMLTNQGAMPLPRIAMMLGIVVPGGFPFGNEELKEFLAGMVKEGVLQIGTGGNYKIVH